MSGGCPFLQAAELRERKGPPSKKADHCQHPGDIVNISIVILKGLQTKQWYMLQNRAKECIHEIIFNFMIGSRRSPPGDHVLSWGNPNVSLAIVFVSVLWILEDKSLWLHDKVD